MIRDQMPAEMHPAAFEIGGHVDQPADRGRVEEVVAVSTRT